MSHYLGDLHQLIVLFFQVRQEKLHKRLQFYHMKQEMVDLVLSREVGVWEAILCMNAGELINLNKEVRIPFPDSSIANIIIPNIIIFLLKSIIFA